MKSLTLTFLLFLSGISGYSQQADTLLLKYQNHRFYFVQTEGNSKLILFLHGGVNNPEFAKTEETPSLDFLLEGNEAFLQTCLSSGFNVLVPVKDDSLNWLIQHNSCLETFDALIMKEGISHTRLFIAGFSDGATASYKLFYDHVSKFDGVMMFNGYPQHSNFNKKVVYDEVKNKTIIYASTRADKVMPYEFMLVEYAKQKAVNPCTYLYLTEGTHNFGAYLKSDFDRLFEIINGTNVNTQTEPIHGFVKNDVLVEFYPFRKSILRKYGFGKETYEANKEQEEKYKK